MQAGQLTKVAPADVPPRHRQGGEIRILLSPATVGATAGFTGTLALNPGEYVAEQYHPYSDKFVYLVSGQLTIRAEGSVLELDPDEAVMIRRGQRHRFENNADQRVYVVFQIAPLAPAPELGHVDTEPVPHPDAPHPAIGPRIEPTVGAS
ncbi:MAG TPA: cupin domain-containing protein [Streptosporangiaceae bacterium]|nr:cupin domain-containing protein [Streptosporangiaceae bacterium]